MNSPDIIAPILEAITALYLFVIKGIVVVLIKTALIVTR